MNNYAERRNCGTSYFLKWGKNWKRTQCSWRAVENTAFFHIYGSCKCQDTMFSGVKFQDGPPKCTGLLWMYGMLRYLLLVLLLHLQCIIPLFGMSANVNQHNYLSTVNFQSNPVDLTASWMKLRIALQCSADLCSTQKHAVDGEIGNFICWELCVGIMEQWNYSLGSSLCFDGARIPGASRNRGIRLCHPCHSPGFISRKSGNETAFLPPSGAQTVWTADKEGHSHRWDVIWHYADCCLTL